jgi:putative transposase
LLSIAYLLIRWIFGVVVWALRPSKSQALEIVVLRHQLEVVQRQVARTQFQPRDRMLLAAASRFLPRARWSSFTVRPETLLRWHRYLVTRRAARWGSKSRGRPPLPPEVKDLVVRLANENPRWGYQRIRGELLKLGHDVSAMTIRNILRRNGLGPAPRHSGPTWTEFLRTQADSILASDFFTVYSLWGKTLYVLFFIELSSRRVHVAGCTARPDSAWVTQQARNLSMRLEDRSMPVRFLVHDHDAKYSGGFDSVFRAEGVDIIRTPIMAPRANAFAERWVKTVKTECLDWMLIVGPRHLLAILRDYVEHYNCGRPHRGLELRCPMPHPRARRPARPRSIRRRTRLGGLLSEYHDAA